METNAYCIECGATLLPDARFCTECGTAIAGAAVPAIVTGVPVALTTASPAIVAAATPAPVDITAVTRPRRSVVAAPQPVADEGPVISRSWLGARSAATPAEPQLTRERRMAGDLPAWEPLPPAELQVRRGSRTR